MATKVMTSIYLTPTQKKALARRARALKTTVSEVIRSALDRHLTATDQDEELQLSLLAPEASKALDRMVGKMDDAHSVCQALRKSLSSKKL